MSMRLFVGGMNHTTTQEDLHRHFHFGDGENAEIVVKDAVIIMDRVTGRSRGFGFVELETEWSPDAVIQEFHESRIAGRVLTVNLAHAKQPTEIKVDARAARAGNGNGPDDRGGCNRRARN